MIYTIGTKDHAFLKFGRSTNAGFRLYNMQMCCPLELELIALAPWDDHLETRIHEYLAPFSIRGEWFKDSEQCQFVVTCLRDDDEQRFLAAFQADLAAQLPHLSTKDWRRRKEREAWWMGKGTIEALRAQDVWKSSVAGERGATGLGSGHGHAETAQQLASDHCAFRKSQ